jgi:hypothetical protein
MSRSPDVSNYLRVLSSSTYWSSTALIFKTCVDIRWEILRTNYQSSEHKKT